MTPSLRRGILVGSVLWTAGMVILASAAASLFFERYPSWRAPAAGHLHGALQSLGMLLAAVTSMVVGLLFVRRGLARVDALRSRLAALREGQGRTARRALSGGDSAARRRPQHPARAA